MAKIYHKLMVALLISGLLLPLLITGHPVRGQIDQRCGSEVSLDVQGALWAETAYADVSIIAPGSIQDNHMEVADSGVSTQPELNIVFPFDSISLQNGTAIAVLQQPANSSRRDIEKSLRIFTQDGQVIPLSASQKPDSLHWWRLLPELEPNQFGVFGYDNETNAFIVEVNWLPDGITIGQPHYLPFQFSPLQFYWAMLYISPNWDYVSHIREREAGGLEVFIYSIPENRYLWQTPYDGNGFASIIWIPNSQIIGLVSGMTSETADQLLAVDQNGATSVLVDLSTLYGEGVSVLPLSGVALSSNQVAFLRNSSLPNTESSLNQLTLLDLNSHQITDLCYSTPHAPPVLGTTSDGQIVLYDASSRRIVIISPRTGDYGYITLNEGMRPLAGTLELSDVPGVSQ